MKAERIPELDEKLRFQVATALIRSGIKLLPYIQSPIENRTRFVLTKSLNVSWRKTRVKLFLTDIQEALIREAKTNKELKTDDLKFIIMPLFEATQMKQQLGDLTEAFDFAVEMTSDLIDTARPQEETRSVGVLKSTLRRLVEHIKEKR